MSAPLTVASASRFAPLAPISSRFSPLAAGTQGSYRVSSDELSEGLEVRALNITELPIDVVRELLRLRRAFGTPGAQVRN
jgi:hypothetical protein